MKKIIVLILCIVVNTWGIVPADKNELKKAREFLKTVDRAELAEVWTNRIAPNLPQQISSYVVFDSVTHFKNEIIMHLKILDKDFEKSKNTVFPRTDRKVRNEMMNILKKDTVQTLCSQAPSYAMLEKGITITQALYFTDDTLYGKSILSINDCK